jgi:hypothetical protein
MAQEVRGEDQRLSSAQQAASNETKRLNNELSVQRARLQVATEIYEFMWTRMRTERLTLENLEKKLYHINQLDLGGATNG